MNKLTKRLSNLSNTYKIIVLQVCVLIAVVAFWAPAGASNTVKTKLATVSAAENQIYTNDGRLFVTGGNGIFEIVGGANGDATVIERMPKQTCGFGGIVEASGVLYVNCTGSNTSHLYAATLTATPTFKRVYTFQSTPLANGLTADSQGRLYIASTFAGRILRLTPSATDPLMFTRGEVWLDGAGIFTNGIKYASGSIYWTDGTSVNRVAIKADGTHDKPKSVFAALTYFDDLAVDSSGVLVADYLGGAIRSYDLNGRSTGTVASGLKGPSSVAKARAPFPTGSFIVTERGANQVSLVTPR